MQLLNSFSEIITKAKTAFKRFPISLTWAIIGTLFSIWFVDQKIDHDVAFVYIKVILSFILGLSWLIATRLLVHYFKEQQGKNRYWLMVIPLLFLALYYFTLPNDSVAFEDYKIPYRFTLFLISGHLTIFFSPFLFAWDKKAYWNYLASIFASFAKSAIFSLVLYLGLVLALVALKYLFKFDFEEIIYLELFIYCLGVINTWIFLADIPTNVLQRTNINYPKALAVFVKYILIPLTLLYLVILYAYSSKILMNWNLPKGWVSYLVIALSILGFSIHILINPIRKTTDSKLIKYFYPWFYYALLPMIVLLFIAIFKRITAYGITENRYLVAVLSFWILGMTLYILFSKRKKLRYFPMSVVVLAMLASFGLWGMFSVSKNSQIKQFKTLFAKMEATNFEVKYTEKTSFESITSYLYKRKALDQVSDVLGYKPMIVFKDETSWGIVRRLSDTLNIKVTDHEERAYGYHYFHAVHDDLIDIKGYDYLIQAYFSARDYPKRVTREGSTTQNKYNFKLDTISKSALFIIKENDSIHKINIKPLLENLMIEKQDNSKVSQEKSTIIADYEDVKVKILFQNLEIRNKKDGVSIPIELMDAGATVLIKEK